MVRARVNLQEVARARRDGIPVNRAVQYHESFRPDHNLVSLVAEPIVEGKGGDRAADVHLLAGNRVDVADGQRLDIYEFNRVAERVIESTTQVQVFGCGDHAALVVPCRIRLIRPIAIGKRIA